MRSPWSSTIRPASQPSEIPDVHIAPGQPELSWRRPACRSRLGKTEHSVCQGSTAFLHRNLLISLVNIDETLSGGSQPIRTAVKITREPYTVASLGDPPLISQLSNGAAF